MSGTVIKVEGVSKKYSRSLKHTMMYGVTDLSRNFLGLNQRTESLRDGEFWALNNVSFDLKRGESLGLIGTNGSGKSTLLKMLCGIFMPDKGRIEIDGRVGALIEVGAGFHPMLTGRENVYVNGSILGMSKKELDKKFDEIVAFAGIGEFIDSPVKHYSSGMYVRLGFSIAAHAEPDILLIDEVLAVGDAKFQRKCFAKIEQLRKNNVTILFVSHSADTITAICDKVILLDNGQLAEEGEPRHVVRTYNMLLFGEQAESNRKGSPKKEDDNNLEAKPSTQMAKGEDGSKVVASESLKAKQHILHGIKSYKEKGNSDKVMYGNKYEARTGNKKVEIIDFGILDEFGERVNIIETGREGTFFLLAYYHEDVKEMVAAVAIKNVKGVVITSASTAFAEAKLGARKDGSLLGIEFSLNVYLRPETYFATFELRKAILDEQYDRREDSLQFTVAASSKTRTSWGLVHFPCEVSVNELSFSD